MEQTLQMRFWSGALAAKGGGLFFNDRCSAPPYPAISLPGVALRLPRATNIQSLRDDLQSTSISFVARSLPSPLTPGYKYSTLPCGQVG